MNPEGGKEKIPPALRRAGSFVDRLNQATVTLRGLASSAFGRVTERIPSREMAVTSSPFTGGATATLRLNTPESILQPGSKAGRRNLGFRAVRPADQSEASR